MRLLKFTLFLSTLLGSTAFAGNETYINGKANSRTVVEIQLSGCFINARHRSEGVEGTEKASIENLTCKVTSTGDFECRTDDRNRTIESSSIIDGKKGESLSEQLYFSSSYFEDKKSELTRFVSKINQNKELCSKAAYTPKDPYHLGRVISSTKWGNRRYGFSGKIVGVIKKGAVYKVRITNIFDGGAHLNPDICSNNLFLKKNVDEGRILTLEKDACFDN